VTSARALSEHHLVDGLVDHLLEARHVRALLLRGQVHEALELGVVELFSPVGPEPDHLLHACHADAGEAYSRGRPARLNVVVAGGVEGGHDLY
jgi:hypothetical protein